MARSKSPLVQRCRLALIKAPTAPKRQADVQSAYLYPDSKVSKWIDRNVHPLVGPVVGWILWLALFSFVNWYRATHGIIDPGWFE